MIGRGIGPFLLVGFVALVATVSFVLPLGGAAAPAIRAPAPSSPVSGMTEPGPLQASTSGMASSPSSAATLLGVPGSSTPTAMAYDAADGYTVLVTPTANATAAGSSMVGTWIFANGFWSEIRPSTAPPAREYASMAFDGGLGAVLLFGGYGPSGTFLSDTWTFSAGQWANRSGASATAPGPRADAKLAYDSAAALLVLVGGYGPSGNLSDTWTYSSGGWTSVPSAVALPPEGAMAYDANASAVVYYGGVSTLGLTCSSSTFEFNGTEWTDVSASVTGHPVALALSSMAEDPSVGGVVMFGGVCGVGIAGIGLTLTTSNSLWRLSTNQWTQLNATTPPPVSYGGDLAYDAAAGELLLFGGVEPTLLSLGTLTQQLQGGSFTFSNGTWARLGPALSASHPLAETGMNVTLEVTNAVTSGGATFSYANLPTGPCLGAMTSSVSCHLTATGSFTIQVNLTLPLGLTGTAIGVANESASVTMQVVAGLAMTPLSADQPKSEVGVPVTVWANVTDGVAVSSYLFGGLPAGCPARNVSTVRCVPQASGTFTVSLTVADMLGVQDTETMPLEVAARASVSSFTLTHSVLDLGMETNASAQTAGGVGPFTVGYGGLPGGCSSLDSLALPCRPAQTGQFRLSMNATDSLGVVASSQADLLVNPDPSVQAFSASASSVAVGGQVTFRLSMSGGTLPYSVHYGGLPAGCESANTTELVCSPNASGTFTIHASATDALGMSATTSSNVTLEVLSGGPTGPHRGGSPSSGFDAFGEGLASGAALVAVVVSALLVRSRHQDIERRRLAEELEREVPAHREGLAGELDGPEPGPRP